MANKNLYTLLRNLQSFQTNFVLPHNSSPRENEAVTRAIFSHTTGCGDMDTLQKIIYIADYVEMNRDFDGVEELRAMAFENLDKAMLMGLHMTVDLLIQQGRVVSQNSLNAIATLENSNFVTA